MMMQFSTPHAIGPYGFGESARNIQALTKDPQKRLARARVFSEIDEVSKREEDWDGCDSAAPSQATRLQAMAEISNFIDAALAEDVGWQHPHVGSNEHGEVSFEWWRDEKRFTVYVSAVDMHYVCSWGADINTTMDAGVLSSGGFYQKWRWFRT